MVNFMNRKEGLIEILIETTKRIYQDHYNGNNEFWFSMLDNNAVYLGSGDPILFGKTAIVQHFKKYDGVKTVILKEEYQAQLQGRTSGVVYGQFILGTAKKNAGVISRFTIVYKIQKNEPIIIHQHNSYEFKNETIFNTEHQNNVPNSLTFQFIRDVISNKDNDITFSIPCGNTNVILNTGIVLYVQSVGKHTEFVCIDRTVTCNTPIGELKKKLPNVFHQVHRCYIVNVKHIHEIKRFEIDMISGAKIPIPAQTYTQTRDELLKYINK